ncbi:hypothetical protein AUJ78_01370 [Candidatus Peregrinibacteria bacterium CG1_02_41_10]|nr:MAG: hypothetical protein AUJ78_01370 [Candidatus Peregrinibacteria bacterium CG1_02_41_10]
MIKVSNLTKYYGPFLAVDKVSFEIKRGEIVGLLGPNGAGKTTILKMLTCFLPPSSGEILIDQLNPLEHSLAIRRKLGYLPENNPLYEDMTVWEYLTTSAQMHDLPSHKINSAVKKTLEECGLKNRIHSTIGELSKGLKQRVGLAQALLHDPQILILDEPTSGLDPNQIVEIRTLIKTLGKEKTVILSTHILPEVEISCNRVIILNQGKIVAQGTPTELRKQTTGHSQISLKIAGPVREITEALKKMPHVEKVEKQEAETPGLYTYQIETSANQDLRNQLTHFIVDHGWELYEISQKQASLEDVFSKLTKQ